MAPFVPTDPPDIPEGIESIPADLMTYALSESKGLIVLIAYLRGKLAGYQLGVAEGRK